MGHLRRGPIYKTAFIRRAPVSKGDFLAFMPRILAGVYFSGRVWECLFYFWRQAAWLVLSWRRTSHRSVKRADSAGANGFRGWARIGFNRMHVSLGTDKEDCVQGLETTRQTRACYALSVSWCYYKSLMTFLTKYLKSDKLICNLSQVTIFRPIQSSKFNHSVNSPQPHLQLNWLRQRSHRETGHIDCKLKSLACHKPSNYLRMNL